MNRVLWYVKAGIGNPLIDMIVIGYTSNQVSLSAFGVQSLYQISLYQMLLSTQSEHEHT